MIAYTSNTPPSLEDGCPIGISRVGLLTAAEILAKDYQVTGEETHAMSICLNSKPLLHPTLIKKKKTSRPLERNSD